MFGDVSRPRPGPARGKNVSLRGAHTEHAARPQTSAMAMRQIDAASCGRAKSRYDRREPDAEPLTRERERRLDRAAERTEARSVTTPRPRPAEPGDGPRRLAGAHHVEAPLRIDRHARPASHRPSVAKAAAALEALDTSAGAQSRSEGVERESGPDCPCVDIPAAPGSAAIRGCGLWLAPREWTAYGFRHGRGVSQSNGGGSRSDGVGGIRQLSAVCPARRDRDDARPVSRALRVRVRLRDRRARRAGGGARPCVLRCGRRGRCGPRGGRDRSGDRGDTGARRDAGGARIEPSRAGGVRVGPHATPLRLSLLALGDELDGHRVDAALRRRP